MKLLAGNSNFNLSKKISKYLKSKLVNSNIKRFSDGEVYVEINENIRGNSIFVIQSTSNPANDNLMELLICIDALRRSSVKNITAVIPYFGYARQDRKVVSRTAISAKLVSNLITNAGANRILTVDLHAGQIQGFFDIPVDNVYASPVLLGDAWKQKYKDMVVVSPDVGGVVRARALAKRLDDADLAIIDKRRPQANMAQVMNVIGEVSGKTCVLIDDLVDTAGTLCEAGRILKERGAVRVVAYITHPVLSGPAVERIEKSELDELVVTDTIPLSETAKACAQIRQLSVAELLAETIRRISDAESVSSLYLD